MYYDDVMASRRGCDLTCTPGEGRIQAACLDWGHVAIVTYTPKRIAH